SCRLFSRFSSNKMQCMFHYVATWKRQRGPQPRIWSKTTSAFSSLQEPCWRKQIKHHSRTMRIQMIVIGALCLGAGSPVWSQEQSAVTAETSSGQAIEAGQSDAAVVGLLQPGQRPNKGSAVQLAQGQRYAPIQRYANW